MPDTPIPLPSAPIRPLSPNANLQPPLSRRGHGPGLVVFDPGYVLAAEPSAETPSKTTLDPAPQYKWAEEGYAVVRISVGGLLCDAQGEAWGVKELGRALEALTQLEECDVKDRFGLLGLTREVYGTPSEYPPAFKEDLVSVLKSSFSIVTVVTFSPEWTIPSPHLTHQPGTAQALETPGTKVYTYPNVSTPDFIVPGRKGFSYATASVAHSRSLKFIKESLGGPWFDLEAIWDEHTYFEFGDRSVEKTMGTMVLEPYVNHIPTMTGGIGRERLSNFYRHHFIFNNPDDTAMELVSRTVGIDRVVDEFVFIFTHNREVDWLIPGIPPTNITLRIPFVAVVNIRGDRLYHEHITWDQGTVLRQLGLMPDYLPFPYPVSGMEGKKLEVRVPAVGEEGARKFEDQRSVKSNGLIRPTGEGVREVEG